MIIGLSIGTLAYRSGYSAILNFHYNHIPLLPLSAENRSSCVADTRSIDVGQLTERVVTEDDHQLISSLRKQLGATEKELEVLIVLMIRHAVSVGLPILVTRANETVFS